MRRHFPLAACLILPVFCGLAHAHGGTYRGPGVPTPPASPRPGDVAPQEVGRRANVGGARAPESFSLPLPEDSSASQRAGWAFFGGPTAQPEPLRWEAWWGFNRDEFLRLKERLHTADVLVGSDLAFLGARAFAPGELKPADDVVFGRVAPVLVELLEQERSCELVSGALVALAKVGDAPGKHEVARRIAPHLAHANQEVAETAAIALGILGDPGQVELLREVLEARVEALRERGLELRSAPSERTRAFAAYGLGLVGQRHDGPVRERIVGVLGRWLRERRPSVAQDDLPVACVVALGLVPLPTDPFCLPPVAAVPRPERMCSFEEQVQWLLCMLEDPHEDARVRAHVPVALARLFDSPQGRRSVLRRRVGERIAARLSSASDEHVDVRHGCAIALGHLLTAGPEDAQGRALLRALEGELHDPALSCLAWISLARASCRPGFDAEPFEALGAGPDGTRTFLIERLAAAGSAQRCYAALALGLVERGADEAGVERAERSLRALRSALEVAGSPDEIGAFATALGLARDRGASEGLRQALERTSEAQARGHVAVALGMVGDEGSTPRLRELVRSSRFQPALVRQAALALGLLGDKEVVPLLLGMLARAPSLSSQAALASALGLIGDARSLDGLMAMARERGQRTDLARAFAAVALGMCADKEQLPWNSRLASDANFRAVTSTLHAPETGKGILDIL
jgi:HEAT repeat protein